MAGLWGGTAVAHADSDAAAPAGVGQLQAGAPHAATSTSRPDRPERAGVRQARARTTVDVDSADAPKPAAASVAARSAVVRGATSAKSRATVAGATIAGVTAQPAGNTSCSSAGAECASVAANRIQALAYRVLTPLGLNASAPPKLLRGGLLWGVTRTAASLTGLVPATGTVTLSASDPKMGTVTGFVSLEEERPGGLLAMVQMASGRLFPTTYYISDPPKLGTLVVDQQTGAFSYRPDIGTGCFDGICGYEFTITARNGLASTDYQGSVPVSYTALSGVISVGDAPGAIAIANDPSKRNYGNVYVVNQSGNTISVINPSGYAVIDTLSGFDGPSGVAASSGTGKIYVTNNSGNTVSVVAPDGSTSSVDAVYSAPYNAIAAMPYLSGNSLSDSVWYQSVVSSGSSAEVALGWIPSGSDISYNFVDMYTAANYGLAADPVTGNIWGFTASGQQGFVQQAACNCTSYSPSYFTTYTLNDAPVSGGAQIALPPATSSGTSYSNYAYITFEGLDEVYVVSMYNSDGVLAPSLSTTIGGFNSPQGLAFGIGGESVFVANSGSDNILEINTNPNSSQFNQIIATVSLPSGSDPQGVACNSTTCFVTDSGTDTVFWFETGSTN
jgi:YVTN family beta-propeller protein